MTGCAGGCGPSGALERATTNRAEVVDTGGTAAPEEVSLSSSRRLTGTCRGDRR